MNTDTPMDRRDFLRVLGLGAMGVTAGVMIHQAVEAGVCFSDGKCPTCYAYNGCDLPEKKVIDIKDLRDTPPASTPPADGLSEEGNQT